MKLRSTVIAAVLLVPGLVLLCVGAATAAESARGTVAVAAGGQLGLELADRSRIERLSGGNRCRACRLDLRRDLSLGAQVVAEIPLNPPDQRARAVEEADPVGHPVPNNHPVSPRAEYSGRWTARCACQQGIQKGALREWLRGGTAISSVE